MGITAYLMFDGQCEEAIQFYAKATGGTVNFIQKYGESPTPTEGADADKIMHARATIMGATLMASDTNDKHQVTVGNNISLSLDFSSTEEMERVFQAMSEGGTVTMPQQDTFWNARFGMCTDKFGINWMFNYDYPKAEQGSTEHQAAHN